MTDLVRRVPVLLAALLVAVALGACGGDDDDDEGGGGGDAKKGGSITIGYTSQPDFLDPALSYTVDGWSAMWLVYMPLVGYKHEAGQAGTEIIPYAAEALPELSEDGLTYTLTLRDGLQYSDGTPAVASDFEHTIRRVLTLESGATPFYTKIEGAEEYIEEGDEDGDISGIETNDETGEITITLTEPSGDFLQILSMNFAGLVPGDTPFRNLTEEPPPGLGPYQITESVPNRQFVMEKNPNFNIPGIPEGNVDRITARIVGSESRQAQQVTRGELDFMFDPPPSDQKPQIRQRYSDRYEEFTTVSTYYFWMNNKIPPFDDPRVREAINIGLDKTAISRITGGEITPGCSFLPPGMAGYDEGLDLAECPFGDPRQPPDVERARQLLEEAGATGERITVWGNDEELTRKVTQEYESQLRRLGFETELQIIDGGVYFQTIGNERTDNLHTGFANWFQDYPHPANFFFLVSGDSIQPTNNQNFGNVDDPEITRGINELEVEPELTDEVAERWGQLNRQLVEGAFVAPYGHRALSNFQSERMNFDCALVHPVMQVDYSTMCLK